MTPKKKRTNRKKRSVRTICFTNGSLLVSFFFYSLKLPYIPAHLPLFFPHFFFSPVSRSNNDFKLVFVCFISFFSSGSLCTYSVYGNQSGTKQKWQKWGAERHKEEHNKGMERVGGGRCPEGRKKDLCQEKIWNVVCRIHFFKKVGGTFF